MVFYFETGSVRGLAIDCEGCHGIKTETEKNGRLMGLICPVYPKKQSQLSKLALLREKVIKLIIGFGHQSLANTCQNSAEHSFAVVLRIAVVGLAAS